MKFTVDITKEEYEGIKDYIKSFGAIENPKKADVQLELQGIISSYLQSNNAISDCINRPEIE